MSCTFNHVWLFVVVRVLAYPFLLYSIFTLMFSSSNWKSVRSILLHASVALFIFVLWILLLIDMIFGAYELQAAIRDWALTPLLFIITISSWYTVIKREKDKVKLIYEKYTEKEILDATSSS